MVGTFNICRYYRILSRGPSQSSMSKSLLILMLMTTQLLAGGGVSGYICISSNGSFGFHFGSSSCTSCQVACEVDGKSRGDCNAQQSCGTSCSKHRIDRFHKVTIGTLGVAKSCDCTHIPVIIESEQPTRVARNLTTADYKQLASLVALLPTIGNCCQPIPQTAFHSNGTSVASDFSLTVIATVVIRC